MAHSPVRASLSKLGANSEEDVLPVVQREVFPVLEAVRRLINEVVTLPEEPVFEAASRPDPTEVKEGTRIYNTTTGLPNWSDGTVWRDAAGNDVT